MAIKIVTGGTTGAADGTLVSSGNRLTFTSTAAIDAHIRCDDGYWSNDQLFDLLPDTIEVSFDGGSTWYGPEDEPITAPEIEDVNYPVKFRQLVAVDPGATASSFDTDGTYNAISALSTPTLTATPGDTQIDLSWTNVANEDGYTVESSADGSSWVAETTTAAGATTYTDTGLTNGVVRYYRVRAEGSGRYSDSAWSSTQSGTPVSSVFASDNFNTGSGDLVGTTPDVGGNWTDGSAGGSPSPVYSSNRIRQEDAATAIAYVNTAASDADYSVQADVIPQSAGSGGVAGVVGRKTAGTGNPNLDCYWADYYDHATAGSRQWRLVKMVDGSATVLGTYTQNIGTTSTTLKLEMNGTAIKVYVDGVERISVTDSDVSAAGYAGVVVGAASSNTNGPWLDNFVAELV